MGVLLSAAVAASIFSSLGAQSSPELPLSEDSAEESSGVADALLADASSGPTTFYMFPEKTTRKQNNSAFGWDGQTIGEVFLTAFDYPVEGQYACDGRTLPTTNDNIALWSVLYNPGGLTLPQYLRTDDTGVPLATSIVWKGRYPGSDDGDPAVAVIDGISYFGVPGLPSRRDSEYLGAIYLISGLNPDMDRSLVPCDGRSLEIKMEQPLFSLIGTAFGGDGNKTFNVPNLTPPAIDGALYYISTRGLYMPRNY